MAFYTIPFNDLSTSASADTFKTMVSAIVPNTAGLRVRIREVVAACADDTPGDTTLAARVMRTAAGGAQGTAGATIAAASVPKADKGGPDSIASCGRDYSTDPTYDTEPLWQTEFNSRGGLAKNWGPDDAPVVAANMVGGLALAPRNAAARKVSGSMTFETF